MTLKYDTELKETVVEVMRVSKTVKGGRNPRFVVYVVVGDLRGCVGYGHGKAREVSEARKKASKSAKKNMIRVPMYKSRTIYYDVHGKSGSGCSILRKAPPGTGIIAGGAMRAAFENLGIHDIVAKFIGPSNVGSMLSATFSALRKLVPPRVIAERRGKKVSELFVKPKLVINK